MRHTIVLRVPAYVLIASTFLASAACRVQRVTEDHAAPSCRCAPGEPCWPKSEEWAALAASLDGKLVQPSSPAEPLEDPFAIQDQPGGLESNGWLHAWNAELSTYAVAAESPADVVKAVRFAHDHDLRLVVKGTGHDYLGRSNAPGSLLIWTHRMRSIAIDDAFVPEGCPPGSGDPAVSIEAGTRWGEVYRAVIEHGRYVQGGGCTSVGAAGGFTQGGGFGWLSKKFGAAASNLLELEVVTADGRLLRANRCQSAELFWALRGGGGGTFGVVTRATMRTHELPSTIGAVLGTIRAKDDAAFRALLVRFVDLYGERLSNERWGEQIHIRGDDSLEISMMFEGLTEAEVEAIWAPFREWIDQRRDVLTGKLEVVALPAAKLWDPAFLETKIPGRTKPAQGEDSKGLFFWANTQGEVSAYWYAYESRWLPAGLFVAPGSTKLAEALFRASREWTVAIHFQKGQAGASPEALARGRETSMNPAVFDAAGLVIIAGSANGVHVGVAGHEPNTTEGERVKANVDRAMSFIHEVAPNAGAYVNEADYFEADWQRSFWGEHYARLLEIKNTYDPDGLFYCHHCVGSERWSSDGICRISDARP